MFKYVEIYNNKNQINLFFNEQVIAYIPNEDLASDIKKEIDRHKNRTCENCKYFDKEKDKRYQYVGMCNHTEAVTPIYTKIDFGCNKWEEKK